MSPARTITTRGAVVLVACTVTSTTIAASQVTTGPGIGRGAWWLLGALLIGLASTRVHRNLALIAVFGLGALLGANYATVTNDLTAATFPVLPGGERPTLDELADNAPNPAISSNIGVLFDLGAAIGDSVLVVPDEGLASRIRAFTPVRATAGTIPADVTEEGPRVQLGSFADRPLVLVGNGETYAWIDQGSGAIIVIGTDEAQRDAG